MRYWILNRPRGGCRECCSLNSLSVPTLISLFAPHNNTLCFLHTPLDHLTAGVRGPLTGGQLLLTIVIIITVMRPPPLWWNFLDSHIYCFFCVFQNAKRWPPLARRRKYAADTFPLIASIELTDRQRLISSNLSGSFACSRCHLARLFDYEAMKENGSPIGDDHCLAPVDRFVRLESSQFSVCRPRLLKLASQLIY